jgi:hypothetical protein
MELSSPDHDKEIVYMRWLPFTLRFSLRTEEADVFHVFIV